jgi:hypothetical protein
MTRCRGAGLGRRLAVRNRHGDRLVGGGRAHRADRRELPRLALAAHLNALLGGLWLIAVAATLDMLRYGERGRRRLAWIVTVPAWDWLITLIASVLGVTGLEYTRGDPANNAVAALLHSVVVLPSLVGAAAWAWGLGGRR